MFAHVDPKIGKYKTYLKWLQSLGEKCGYVVEWDWMRIPSTKNVCQVGRKRTFIESNVEAAKNVETAIQELLGKYPSFEIREIGKRNAPQHQHDTATTEDK